MRVRPGVIDPALKLHAGNDSGEGHPVDLAPAAAVTQHKIQTEAKPDCCDQPERRELAFLQGVWPGLC